MRDPGDVATKVKRRLQLDLIQADSCRAGGIGELKKPAAVAETLRCRGGSTRRKLSISTLASLSSGRVRAELRDAGDVI